ncbi:polysaccharide deacetylase family protein [Rariglobus hedericola]|uniref:Polysaccharide deacetylase family protein n=1 Tax=Rariglobus hedericola TaxID=2597822 RepID=A0A556QKW5_9BACT|nr:polysaccharide deacetylase family protein [Rariglobus hedericola]TSJ77290.1 polysaccharide deacetylase family protein [Rariglobus hedericola]
MKTSALITCLALVLSPFAAFAETGTTRIAQWKDDKKSPFMLMFDDACPSQVGNAVPELKKRELAATFYNFPAAGHYQGNKAFWETTVPAIPGFVYGNHTINHKGFSSVTDAEKEIADANATIMRLFPGKSPRLVSYADPGGVKNAISGPEIDSILAKNNLVRRPEFGGHGGGIAYRTASDVLAAVDRAIGKGTQEYIIFHGVGGDWIVFPQAEFTQLLDGLVTRRDSLWITDTISVHKYETARAKAQVKFKNDGPAQIRVLLTADVNLALYDQPLTLITQVPAAWKKCQVVQGTSKVTVPVENGEARYDAVPGATMITLTPAG